MFEALLNLERRRRRRQFSSVIRDLRADYISELSLSSSCVIDSPHRSGVTWMDLDRNNNRFLITVSTERRIAIFDTHKRKKHVSPVSLCEGVKSKPLLTSPSCVNWLPFDKGIFITSTFGGQIIAWDTKQLTPAIKFNPADHVYSCHTSGISSRNILVAAACSQGLICLCDLRSGAVTLTMEGHSGNVYAVQWSPSNEYVLCSAGEDETVRLWDIRRIGWICAFDKHNIVSPAESCGRISRKAKTWSERVPSSHTGPANGLTFLPDGGYVVSTGWDGQLRLWDTFTGKHIHITHQVPVLANKGKKAVQLSVDYDGTYLFHPNCHPNNSNIAVVHCATGEIVTQLKGHFRTVNCCSFNPVFDELYSGSMDNGIMVWRPHEEMQAFNDIDEENLFDD